MHLCIWKVVDKPRFASEVERLPYEMYVLPNSSAGTLQILVRDEQQEAVRLAVHKTGNVQRVNVKIKCGSCHFGPSDMDADWRNKPTCIGESLRQQPQYESFRAVLLTQTMKELRLSPAASGHTETGWWAHETFCACAALPKREEAAAREMKRNSVSELPPKEGAAEEEITVAAEVLPEKKGSATALEAKSYYATSAPGNKSSKGVKRRQRRSRA